MADPIRVEIDGDVMSVVIDREDRRNALNDAALAAIARALDEGERRGLAAVVLAGTGVKAFSAGSDVKELASQGLEDRVAHTHLGQVLFERLEEHPAAVIAAVEGYCLGGGFEMALACDLRIAGAGATFGMPEVALHALPTWGGTYRLARAVGVARAKEVVLFGRRLSAEEAVAWGIAAEAVPAGQALPRAREIAAAVARDTDRATFARAKALVGLGVDAPARVARHMELLADRAQLASEAFQRGAAGFVEGRR